MLLAVSKVGKGGLAVGFGGHIRPLRFPNFSGFSWAFGQWARRNPAWAVDGRDHKAGLGAWEGDHWANPYAIAGANLHPRNASGRETCLPRCNRRAVGCARRNQQPSAWPCFLPA